MEVHKVIERMNKKAATVPGDIPMKLIAEFVRKTVNFLMISVDTEFACMRSYSLCS